MYSGYSPYAHPAAMGGYPAPGTVAMAPSTEGYVPPYPGPFQPGDTAHAQIMSPDGRMLYQIFRCVNCGSLGTRNVG